MLARPQRSPSETAATLPLAVVALRRPHLTLSTVASRLSLSCSSGARICRRAGLARLSQHGPMPRCARHERAQPGELLHLEGKNARASPQGRAAHHGRSVRPDRRGGIRVRASGDRRRLAGGVSAGARRRGRGQRLRLPAGRDGYTAPAGIDRMPAWQDCRQPSDSASTGTTW